jgi:Family of unknown function (DUF6325)
MQPQDDELGPIDVLIIGFPAGAPMTGEAIPLFLDLVDRGIIRVFDALFVKKNADGAVSGIDFADLDAARAGRLVAFAGASTGLLGSDDVALAAEQLEPGDAAVVIIYENRWAAPFAAAVRRNGGVLIADERIHVQELIAALDVAEAA